VDFAYASAGEQAPRLVSTERMFPALMQAMSYSLFPEHQPINPYKRTALRRADVYWLFREELLPLDLRLLARALSG
jgi:hypothetical protein